MSSFLRWKTGVAVCILICLMLLSVNAWAAPVSLEVMTGQMILLGFRGTGDNADNDQEFQAILEDIRSGRVGGVVLFNRDAVTKRSLRNIASLEQVKLLTWRLQKEAPIPLFVGIDQEGGNVRRLREEHGAMPLPSAAELGKGTADTTYAVGVRLGSELHGLGINLNFAPCLDVNSNPRSPVIGYLGRSFSRDPALVAEHGLAFAKGLSAAGVIPCYKHFPGHGSATQDSHLGLTDISKTWSSGELQPYKKILPVSPPAMVMPGHLVHATLGGKFPASLSPAIITKLLRKELNWNGVVITDDLQMQAIEGHYGAKEMIRLAVEAGADILLLGNNLRYDKDEGRITHELLMELVEEGALSRERIEESYVRIMLLKKTVLGLL